MPRQAPHRTPPILRPKGHLSRTALRALGIVALAPLLSIMLRSLGDAVLTGPLFDAVREIGTVLTRTFSLNDVPPDQREHVLYLLFLPTCALLVALARLTFGIRVLGFRSILISVGFHQSGIVPSLMLIAISVATVVLVRPWLRRIRLPYYARVSVILCIVASTMVGGLLAGPWMRSDLVWGVAYFPVIVLGMLAEGIARTLDRDNVVTAWWRAITTILLAFVIALVCWVPPLRSLLLQFPELVLTQIVAIVLISEFLDLRILQDWDRRVANRLLASRGAGVRAIRVAVVRNRLEAGAEGRPGRPERSRQAPRSVQKVVGALRRSRFEVKVFEGDDSLLPALRRFLPPIVPGARPRGIVLNLAHGVRGIARATHVPAMLEMSDIPYVGPNPHGQAVLADRLMVRTLLREAGIPTAAFRVVADRRDAIEGVQYPAIVRPRHESPVRPRIVRGPRALRAAVRAILRPPGQEAMVEERVTGRRISVGLLGNVRLECLPLVELSPRGGGKLCPALLDEAVARQIREYAVATFHACGCRDFARVDLCLDASGEIRVLEVGSLGILARRGAFAIAAAAAGRTYRQLISTIVEVARRREFRERERRPGRRRKDPNLATAPRDPGPAAAGSLDQPLRPERAGLPAATGTPSAIR